MIAGYSNFPGYGNTPPGGIKGFEDIFTESKNLNEVKRIEKIDALILWGGEDIGTSLYNEQPYNAYAQYHPSARDLFEWELLKICTRRKIPIIGVCRGAQILCAFAGGKLAQDVKGHLQSHTITSEDKQIFKVNSSHHQMMYPYSIDHQMLAYDMPSHFESKNYEGLTKKEKDNVILFGEPEVVYFSEVKGIGIQCHPEWPDSPANFNKWVKEQILIHLYGENKQ